MVSWLNTRMHSPHRPFLFSKIERWVHILDDEVEALIQDANFVSTCFEAQTLRTGERELKEKQRVRVYSSVN